MHLPADAEFLLLTNAVAFPNFVGTRKIWFVYIVYVALSFRMFS
jgi:hypothetical protein